MFTSVSRFKQGFYRADNHEMNFPQFCSLPRQSRSSPLEELSKSCRAESILVHSAFLSNLCPKSALLSNKPVISLQKSRYCAFFDPSPESYSPIATFSDLSGFLQHKDNCLEIPCPWLVNLLIPLEVKSLLLENVYL